ncbi:glutathione S-transferase [Diaporthe amygdali]|uniref:glutathione S-transferase n=1 Tax=Phomopsis amygdali TaxID=1214568 RepID=UPI0022FE4684|nr:glutathione S-transferase [Diaporthe amygdali]KAJ0121080.1 glutathione S-transferase [Diaporthe amygdali]
MKANAREVQGDLRYDGQVIIYIIRADQTSYINYMKPLILAEELQIDYIISVIDTKSAWYSQIHPEKYVPAIKDWCPEAQKEIVVFESTACMQYLADRYDSDGLWTGRNAAERAAVLSWTAYQTAGLGLHENCVRQWDILEGRLRLPDQEYIALPDRPTVADISYFPFAMPWMFQFLDVEIGNYPQIRAWGNRMMARNAVRGVVERGPTYGHQFDNE